MTRCYCLTLIDGSLVAFTADRCRRDGPVVLFETHTGDAEHPWTVVRALHHDHVCHIERPRRKPAAECTPSTIHSGCQW